MHSRIFQSLRGGWPWQGHTSVPLMGALRAKMKVQRHMYSNDERMREKKVQEAQAAADAVRAKAAKGTTQPLPLVPLAKPKLDRRFWIKKQQNKARKQARLARLAAIREATAVQLAARKADTLPATATVDDAPF